MIKVQYSLPVWVWESEPLGVIDNQLPHLLEELPCRGDYVGTLVHWNRFTVRDFYWLKDHVVIELEVTPMGQVFKRGDRVIHRNTGVRGTVLRRALFKRAVVLWDGTPGIIKRRWVKQRDLCSSS